MRARFVSSLMLLMAVLAALAGAQVVLTDDANTSSFSAKTNYGSSIALIVCSGSNTYLKFGFANLGPGITSSNVSKATLVLYADFVLTSGTMDVYQVSGSWSEGAITWNNAPALGTKLFSAVSVTSTGYLSLDVTTTVQAWLNGTLANNGIALVPSSGSKISISFDSKENIFTSHTAQLPLVLVSAGPQGPQGPQGVQGPAGPQGTTGAQGPVGPAGAAGATGSQGPAGSQGPQGVMGVTGASGSQGPAGPAGGNGTGFNFRNAFDNSASYSANDVVTYTGSSYVATAASAGPNNPTPDTNAAAWSIMAAQGTAGAAGAQGPAGPSGAPGAQGPAGAPGPAGAAGPAGPGGPAGPMGQTGPQGPMGPAGPTGSISSNFQAFSTGGSTGTFTVPNGVSTIQIEAVGGGGPGAYGQARGGGGGGGGSGAYQKVVLSVSPGSTYSVYVGAGGFTGLGSQVTTVKDQNGTMVACGAGAPADSGLGLGGSGGNYVLSCLGNQGLPTANMVNIAGQVGGSAQPISIGPVPPYGFTQTVIAPGGGGAPVMLGAGAGGQGGPNAGGLTGSNGSPGYVLISW